MALHIYAAIARDDDGNPKGQFPEGVVERILAWQGPRIWEEDYDDEFPMSKLVEGKGAVRIREIADQMRERNYPIDWDLLAYIDHFHID